MTMREFLKRFGANQSGIAALEVAFILPFLLFLYFGLLDLTAMISLNRKITYAASVVADLVTQNDGTVVAGDIDDYFNAAALVLAPTPMSSIRVEVYQYRNVSGVITNQWSRNNGSGGTCSAPTTAGMNSLMSDGNDIVVAVLCTNYTPYVATFLGERVLGATSFSMNEQIALRPRQSATLNCTGC